MIHQFEKFLRKVRKSNGDYLLDKTVETYVYYVSEYIGNLNKFDDIDSMISYMNKLINQRPSLVIYSAFRMFLLFMGVDKKGLQLKSLKAPDKSSNFMSSKRFLQSKVLSKQELRSLFNSVEDSTKLLFSALYDTACRRSELLGIKYGDVEFKKQPKNNIYASVNVLGKGAKSRTVYFSKKTVELLRLINGHEDKHEKEDKLFEIKKSNNKLYANQHQAIYYIISKHTKKILNRNITPHCFRHTRLTHLANAGSDVLGIKSYAGHENISTSQIYIEVSSFLGKKTIEQFGGESILDNQEAEE